MVRRGMKNQKILSNTRETLGSGVQSKRKKPEYFLKETSKMRQKNEHGLKPKKGKVKATLQLKQRLKSEEKLCLGAMQNIAKLIPKVSEKSDRLRQLLREKTERNWTESQVHLNEKKGKDDRIVMPSTFCRRPR